MRCFKVDRAEILEKLEEYKNVPGHEPNYEILTDDQLEKLLNALERSFDELFKD
jgi:hypothetical protein